MTNTELKTMIPANDELTEDDLQHVAGGCILPVAVRPAVTLYGKVVYSVACLAAQLKNLCR